MKEFWRVMMEQETGEVVQHGRTFESVDEAHDWIIRNRLDDQHPECRFYIEPDVLTSGALADLFRM